MDFGPWTLDFREAVEPPRRQERQGERENGKVRIGTSGREGPEFESLRHWRLFGICDFPRPTRAVFRVLRGRNP
jgi:hypothetical protein